MSPSARKIPAVIALLASGFLLAVGFNNCGDPSSPKSEVSASSLPGTCDEILFDQYKTNVYPFFRQESTCVSCHIEGGQGLGVFASADAQVAFSAFNAAGVSKLSYMATNSQHKPPHTGEQNRAAVDTWSAVWNKNQTDYLDCVSKAQNGGVNESIVTAAKPAPNIYADETASQTLTWDLSLAEDLDASVTRSIPGKISIDVRVLYQNNKVAGYIFSNPSFQLKDPSQILVIEGLFFHINKVPIPSQTTFTSLSKVATGASVIPLMNAQANTLIQPVASTDVFQLYIQRIAPAAGIGDSGSPLTPVIRVSDQSTGSTTLIRSATANVNIVRDSGILRWCLTESATKPESADAPCVTSDPTAAVNGWRLARPTTYSFSSADGPKRLYLWVVNQDLKMNDDPGVVEVTLDRVAPAAPTIASVSVTDSQVATMTLTHPAVSDVAGWCVIEQNSIKAAPGTPSLNDVCWRWADNNAKPTTVGFKGGGSRDIYVFVRDKAGNVSARSAKFTATNSFGAITFSQLTSSGGGPRAIFQNHCFTCHGAPGNPGFNKLQLFNYAAAVDAAGSGVLVSRINNIISPMPNINGGLMAQRYRDLIRLWTLPEEGNQPLP